MKKITIFLAMLAIAVSVNGQKIIYVKNIKIEPGTFWSEPIPSSIDEIVKNDSTLQILQVSAENFEMLKKIKGNDPNCIFAAKIIVSITGYYDFMFFRDGADTVVSHFLEGNQKWIPGNLKKKFSAIREKFFN